MKIVYQLAKDQKHIALVQKATLTTDAFGIEQTHGLFGSAEWWADIQTGNLPLHKLRGVIDRVFMGSMNDWPECTVLSEAGDHSNWTRYCQEPSLDRFYRVGARIEIDYVEQKSRLKGWSAGALQKNVIEIWIQDID